MYSVFQFAKSLKFYNHFKNTFLIIGACQKPEILGNRDDSFVELAITRVSVFIIFTVEAFLMSFLAFALFDLNWSKVTPQKSMQTENFDIAASYFHICQINFREDMQKKTALCPSPSPVSRRVWLHPQNIAFLTDQ